MLILTVVLFAILATTPGTSQDRTGEPNLVAQYDRALAIVDKRERKYLCKGTKQYLNVKRNATWKWQDEIAVPRTRTSYADRRTKCSPYLKWQAKLWAHRADEVFRTYVALSDPREAICHVFGTYCEQALAVSRCESGYAHSVRAHNGQYLGMFQMGSSERAKYGHSMEPLGQARAAYAYFVASGRDWSPWSCKPY